MKKTSLSLVFLVGGLVTLVLAKDFWENPYTEWKQKDVVKMLTNSPWAKQDVVTRTWGGRGDSRGTGTAAGEREFYDKYTVRFLSALPIRQAYVRSIQLMNNYDKLPPAQQQSIDQQLAPMLNMDVTDRIIVVLECSTSDPQLQMEIDRALKTNTTETLKQSAFLISNRLGRVELKEYVPPSPQTPGATFVFPRTVDGQPVVTREDKEIKVEMWVPGVGTKLYVSKKTKDMVYNGHLEV